MKKLSILVLCMVMAFIASGCASDEITGILDARDAAEAEYTSFDYENVSYSFAETEPFTGEDGGLYITNYEQEEYATFTQLRNGDRISHGTIVNNRGTSVESFGKYDYYEKSGWGYYDVKGVGRYKQESLQTKANDKLGDYIKGLGASDFESVTVKKLTGGGKKLHFRLDPSSIPEDFASEYIVSMVGFMPPEFDTAHASLISFEYTLVLDENFLNKKEQWEIKAQLDLKSGVTAYFTNRETMDITKHYNIKDDHLVFPGDLDEYQDHATYTANLYK